MFLLVTAKRLYNFCGGVKTVSPTGCWGGGELTLSACFCYLKVSLMSAGLLAAALCACARVFVSANNV